MRVILDTNILISALLVQSGPPGAIYLAWIEGGFTLLTCADQLTEMRATLRKLAIAERIRPHDAGRLMNDLKHFAEGVDPCPASIARRTRMTTLCWRPPRLAMRIIW